MVIVFLMICLILPLGNWDRLRSQTASKETEELTEIPDLPNFQTMSYFIQNVV